MGSVETIIRRDRKSGEERVVYRAVPWDRVEQRKGPTETFPTERAARDHVRAWEAQRLADASQAGVPVKYKRVLASEYGLVFAAEPDVEDETRTSRRSSSNRICANGYFAGKYLDEITRFDVVQWDAHMRDVQHYAEGTRRKYMGFLSQMFEAAIRDGIVQANPTTGVKRAPHVTRGKKRIPESEDFESLVAFLPLHWRVVAVLAASSGMRAGEICGLQWQDVDLHNGIVHIRQTRLISNRIRGYTKGKTQRSVPLTPETVAVLRQHARVHACANDDFVAVKQNGDPMKISRIRNGWPEQMIHWQKHMRENEGRLVEGPRFHDLRHYAAHDLINRRAPVQTLRAFLGHKNLNTTQIYMDDVNVDEMREAMLQPRRTKRERHLQAV